MDAVGTPRSQGVSVLKCSRNECVAIVGGARQHDRSGFNQLERECRVEHVGGRQAVVNPAPFWTDRCRDHVHERRNVVAGLALALLDRLNLERSPLPAGAGVCPWHHSLSRPSLGCRELYREPALHLAPLGPDGADLVSGVAIDHGLTTTLARPFRSGLDRALVAAPRAKARRSAVDDPRCEQSSVAGAIDRYAGDRNSRRHLHRREQRIHPPEVLAGDRHADDRQLRIGGGHPRQRR